MFGGHIDLFSFHESVAFFKMGNNDAAISIIILENFLTRPD